MLQIIDHINFRVSVQLDPTSMSAIFGHNCVISEDAKIGTSTRIGNFVFIRDNTTIGNDCMIGSYVDIEGDVRIGNFVSLQSGCYLTRGVIVEDEVFCGPRIVTMNDKNISYRRPSLTFTRSAPRLLRAARIGGGSILCPGVTVGENALIGAGSVVTQDVPDRCIAMGNPARVVGSVPADQII
jgi:acetyltransferase-like isoleucine patch superfamily enzyme